jgi:hypothetical protein
MAPLVALLLAAAAAFAEPAAVAPPPKLSRSNWQRAVDHARGLHDAVKAQIDRMDFSGAPPAELTQGSGRARQVPKEGRLRRDVPRAAPEAPAAPVSAPRALALDLAPPPAPRGFAPASASARGSATLEPLTVHSLPTLEQAVAPLGPDAVAPQILEDPRCSDPRARADRRRCPASRGI